MTKLHWLDDLDGLVIQGDVLDGLARLEDASVDAIVTDPPYDLLQTSRRGSGRSNEPDNPYGRHGSRGGGFMGLAWDATGVAFEKATWEACLRVLKPGGHMLVFGATRTYHRLVTAIENAGFEVRDTVMWHHGQGFPKSRDISRDLAATIPAAARCVCGQHSIGKASNSPVDYRPELDSSDEQPRSVADNDQPFSPSLTDAPEHSRGDQRKDDRQLSRKHSPVGSSTDRPSNEGSVRRVSHPSAASPTDDNAPSDNPPSTLSSEGAMADDRTGRRKSRTRHSGGDSVICSWQPPYGASQYYHICGVCGKWVAREGIGTALKPATELICLARRPLAAQNVAANVLKFGTGGLNIDATRLEYADEADKASATPQGRVTSKPSAAIGAEPDAGRDLGRVEFKRPELKGRWPANVLLECTCDDPQPLPEKARARRGEPSQERRYDQEGATDLAAKPGTRREGGGAIHTDPDCPAALLDAQSGVLKSGTGAVKRKTAAGHQGSTYRKENRPEGTPNVEYGDSGGASRFFPTMHTDPECPAAMLDAQSGLTQSSGVLNRFDDGAKPFGGGKGHPYTSVPGHDDFGGASRFFYGAKATKKERGAGNTHPTVKPIAVMRWLVRLVTPPGGVVLDPFMGTGSTLIAAHGEGFGFIGIDISPEYCEIALRRVKERKS